ncbi:DEAD/DEAH box helicase [Luteolibacter sp. AS25]|uniref:DEAD/DEAH box helicase n=1 Tax=Luteolibacter sp. AS25 TaxID=3135776 RepID=UPI00398A6187
MNNRASRLAHAYFSAMSFETFGLGKQIENAISKAGYSEPTPIQLAAIPKVMAKNDLIGIAQTGTGKTAAFVLPILHHLFKEEGKKSREPRSLIIAPTRELALQISENITTYGQNLPVRVATIYGGVDEEAQIKAARKGVDIIVATPGRLMDLSSRDKIDFSFLEILVLDEADRMLHMGFLPDIEAIVEILPRRRQTLMFSATFPHEVESLARKFLYNPKRVQIGAKSDPALTVNQSVYEVAPHLKNALLVALLGSPKMKRVLVFVRMKDGVNRLTEFLKNSKISASKLHSSRSQEQREKALQNFKDGNIRVLVATDIVARGIDVEGVTHVVNFDFPVNPEDYIHRIGRTGRAEAEGEALSFVPKGDQNLLGILEMSIGRRIPKKRLRGFDYHAKSNPANTPSGPAKKDWRKRTRETDVNKAAKKAPRKFAKKRAPKRENRK